MPPTDSPMADQDFSPSALEPCLDALRHIVHCLEPNLPFREVLHRVLCALSVDLPFGRPHIVVQNPENGNLHLSMAEGQVSVPHLTYAPGRGITGQVFASGRPVIVDCMKTHPDFMNRLFERSEEQLRSLAFLCVPVVTKDRTGKHERVTVGTLSADTPMASPEVLRLRCRLLEVVADLVGHHVACLQEDMLRQKDHCTRQDDRPLPSVLQGMSSIVVLSRSMNHVLHHAAQAAPGQTTILLRGESGSGKALMASAIHQCSPRADRPFIRLNCAALPAELVEGELFGWQKGACTSARQTRRGVFEQADSGTLFLDEIGDLSLSAQAKVLRAVQEREIMRPGSERPIPVDVRLICSTHQPLEKLVEKGLFREDLYYRINVFPLFLPPLRERKEDILPLAEHFLHLFSQSYGRATPLISPQAADALLGWRWPGNVRELQNAMERAVLLCDDGLVRPCHLPPPLRTVPAREPEPSSLGFREEVGRLEKTRLEEALARSRGNIHQAARNIDITYRIFYYKMKKYGIDYRSFLPR